MTGPVKRILVVDSHAVTRRGIQVALADSRFQVVAEVSDGETAIRVAGTVAPDIVLLDYVLPGVSGLETAIELRCAHPGLEVLIYSMPLADDVIARLLKAGIQGYVSKSEPLSELLAALEALALHRVRFSTTVKEAMVERVLDGKQLSAFGLLSRREVELVQLIAEGLQAREIAARLGISKKTVEAHRVNTSNKINCRRTADIVRYAIRNNLIQL